LNPRALQKLATSQLAKASTAASDAKSIASQAPLAALKSRPGSAAGGDGGLGGAEELLEEGSDTSRCGLEACVCGGICACECECVCAFVFGRYQ